MSLKKILLLLIGLTAVGLFFFLDLDRFLTLEQLKTNRQLLQQYHAEHTLLMVAAFMAVYIIQTGLALPGATILFLAAWLGTLYAVIAASVGATLSLLVTRYLLRDAVVHRFGHKLEGINQELEQRGLNYLLFLRLVPLFPFFLVNLAAGLTRLPLRTFVLGTFFEITNLSDIASGRVLGSFALLGLFALLPALYAKINAKRSSRAAE